MGTFTMRRTIILTAIASMTLAACGRGSPPDPVDGTAQAIQSAADQSDRTSKDIQSSIDMSRQQDDMRRSQESAEATGAQIRAESAPSAVAKSAATP
jgi:hypothetical protein